MELRRRVSASRGWVWAARLCLGIVFLINMNAAVAYILHPTRYISGYELEGVAGRVVIQAIGALFIMWNATYPLVIVNPARYQALFAIVLAQQLIGLTAESWLVISLPSGHDALRLTGIRFITFDGVGLILMLAVFLLGRLVLQRDSST